MTRKKALIPIHKVATIFPDMSEEEYENFKDNIRINKLLEPILLYKGKIIDGKHRYRACLETGTEPRFQEWNGKGSLPGLVASFMMTPPAIISTLSAKK